MASNSILSFGKNTIIYGMGSMLTRSIGIITLPLFTRYLTPEDYGILALLGLLSMVMQSIFGLGLNSAMGPSYFEGANEARKAQTVWTTFYLLLMSAILLILIGWSIPELLSQLTFQTDKYSRFIPFSLTGLAFSVLAVPFMLRLQFEKKSQTFVLITMSSAIIAPLMMVIGVVLLKLGALGSVLSQMITQIYTFSVFCYLASKSLSISFKSEIAKDLLRLGIPMIPSFAFLYILMQSNRYLLQVLTDIEQVGIYSIGFNLGMTLNIVVSAVSTAWYPFFMSYVDKREEAASIFGKIFTCYSYAVGAAAISFFIFSKPVVYTLTQPKFYGAWVVVGFVASAYLSIGLFNQLLPPMYFGKKVKYTALSQGAAAVLSLPINFILIKNWGIIGAGASLAISHATLVGLQFMINKYYLNNHLKINYENTKVMKISFLFVLFLLLSFGNTFQDIVFIWLYSISLFLIFTVVLFLAIEPKERKLILEAVKKYAMR